MRLARATLQIVRPYSSLLAFLSLMAPLYIKTNNLAPSLRKAIPLLFISMCTFIINDLDDLEKDLVNHPERPLPSRQLRPAFVATLYYVCLASALLSTHFFVGDNPTAFLYYTLLTLCISYSYVVEYLPGIKPIYVAGASAVPILILVSYYPREHFLFLVAVAVFFFMLGRELCKDIIDRPGDPFSILHRIEPRRMASLAFLSQGIGLVLLSPRIDGPLGILDLLLMVLLFAASCLCWFRLRRLTVATALMKAVIYLGLYFLI